MFILSRFRAALALGCALLATAACGGGSGEASPRPDIILVSLDTLRPDHLDLYGYDRETAPTITGLAQMSAVFDNAYSQAPQTAPSHMTLFTGLYPSAHGVQNLEEEDNRALSPSIPLLAETLQSAGYRTAGFTGGGHMGPTLGFDRGFDTFEVGGWQFKRAVEWVRERPDDGRPFFLLVHTYAIHDPYLSAPNFQKFNDPAYSGEIIGNRDELEAISGKEWENQHQAFWERVDKESEEDLVRLRDLYDAAILSTDLQLNQLLGSLQDLGVFDEALLIVLSDHGEEFKDHGDYLHESLYQELLRVPLLMRFPGELGSSLAGSRVQATVRLIDIMPTLLDYLGLEGAERLQGSSFLSALEAPQRVVPREMMSEWPRGGLRALQQDAWQLVVNADGSEELYNLEVDPAESENLIAADTAAAERLRRRLGQLVAESEGIQQLVSTGEVQDLDPEVKKQLEALGYIE